MIYPAFFFSHGSPMMALATAESDPYVGVLQNIHTTLPRPQAILMISAHWGTRGKYVSVSEHPKTLYDFYGFPAELSAIQYNARGFSQGAKLLEQYVPNIHWTSVERGLDHGAWTVLRHVFPQADIPIFSLSVDLSDGPEAHLALGTALQPLREEGVCIMASGNIVHSLEYADFSGQIGIQPYPFAQAFDAAFAQAIEEQQYTKLFQPHALPWWHESVPTWEHYLPALTILGTRHTNEPLTWLYEGFELGSIGRRAWHVG